MDSKATEIRYAEWYARIQDWAQSGMDKSEYCKMHGIVPKTFYYYQRRIRARLAEQLEQGQALPEGIEGCGLLPDGNVERIPAVLDGILHDGLQGQRRHSKEGIAR